jgi:O-antigen/teichoic acid export membrane protein
MKETTQTGESSRLVAIGLGSAWLQFGSGLIVSFLRYALLFKYVPKQDLGLGILLMTAVTFLGILDAAIGPGIATEVGYAWKDRLPGEVVSSCRYLYRKAFGIFIVLSVGILPLVMYSAKDYPNRILIVSLFVLFATRSGLAFFSGSKTHILTGTGWYYAGRTAQTATDLVGLAALFLLLRARLGVIAIGIGAVVEGLILWLVVSWFFSKRFGTTFIEAPNPEIVQRLKASSISMLGNSIGVVLIYNTDAFFLARYVGLGTVADYNIAYKLALTTTTVCIPFYNAIYPRFVTALRDSDRKEIRSFFALVRLNHILASGLSIAILLLGKRLIDLWVGPGHYIGTFVLGILVVTYMLDNIHFPHGYTFLSRGRSSILMYSALCAGVLNLAFTAYLAPRFGAPGIAAGTFLAQLVCTNIALPFLSLRELRYSFLDYAYTALLPSAAIWILPAGYWIFRFGLR